MRPLSVLTIFLRLLLAGIFLWAGLVKAGASEQLTLTIATLGLVPDTWIWPIAVILPWAEILAAVLLLVPYTVRIGAIAIFGLCLLFAGVIASALFRGLIVDCSCFGEGTPSADKMILTVVRDVVLAGLAAFVYAAQAWQRPKNSRECASVRNP